MATTTLDNLISETGRRPGIGAAAEPLMRELLQFMTRGPGGISAFLDRFRSAGLGAEVASFARGDDETPLPAQAVDTVMGETTVANMARRAGLAPAAAATAMGFAIPKLISLLAPGGKPPVALPREVQSFIGQSDQVPPVAMATVREEEQVRPVAMTTVPAARSSGLMWLLGLLALAILAGIILTMMTRRPAPVATAPAAVAPVVPAPAPAVAPAPAPAPAEPVATINLDQSVLNFATGSAVVPAAAADTLRNAAAQIKALPAGSSVEVAGHTDNTGDAAANLALSQRRAEAVKAALIEEGVDGNMLTARGYGQTRPVASNDTDEGRLQNRRTELDIIRH